MKKMGMTNIYNPKKEELMSKYLGFTLDYFVKRQLNRNVANTEGSPFNLPACSRKEIGAFLGISDQQLHKYRKGVNRLPFISFIQLIWWEKFAVSFEDFMERFQELLFNDKEWQDLMRKENATYYEEVTKQINEKSEWWLR